MKRLLSSPASFCGIFFIPAAIFAGSWTEVPGAAPDYSGIYGVAVVSANDVWAVGYTGRNNSRGLIEHWDGTAWSVVAVQANASQLSGISARSSKDIWAVGGSATAQTLVEHWTGRHWGFVSSPNPSRYAYLDAVSVSSRDDAWAVGYSLDLDTYILMHWDGTTWSLVDGPPANASQLLSIKAFASDDVWAVGYKDNDIETRTSATFTLHWNGTAWSEIPSPDVDDGNFLSGVDGAASNDVWAVGGSFDPLNAHPLALHWDGATWTVVPTLGANNESTFFGLTALSSTNIVAVGQSGAAPFSAHWDGIQWRLLPTPPVMDQHGSLRAISGRDGSVWAVGYQGLTIGDDLFFHWTLSAD